MSDLEKAFNKLKSKQLRNKKLFDYYDGNQPLVYSAERLSEVFGGTFAKFNQNWCQVVVDATLDRLSLMGFDPIGGNTAADKRLDELWSRYHLELDADEVHKGALIAGESYIIAWKRQDGTIDVYYNSPQMCHIFYKPDYPKEKQFAAKWYKGDDEKWHITLYYPDRLEYYVSQGEILPESISGFKPEKKTAENPFKVIPVFHFRCPGDLSNIITIQDAVNKLFADMMVAGEYGAFKQRWVISNSDTAELKNRPGEVWGIPAGDGVGQGASVGEFEGEDLTIFTTAIEKLANVIAILTKTPKHYLADVGAGISGDALIAMEAPLVKKCEKLIKQFSVTWQELASFLLTLDGTQELPAYQILPRWGRVKAEQPLAEFQAINFGTSSGIPLVTMLRRQGWDKSAIEQMKADQEAEKKEKNSMSKTLLDAARDEQNMANSTGLEATDGANA